MDIPYEEVESEKRYILPPADAVIDPKQQTCAYPFKELCGAGVAYKLIEALFGACGKDIEDVDYLMENVAIATVGDVMDLVGENRIFVKQGLEMLKRTNNLGLRALMECTGVPVERLSAYQICDRTVPERKRETGYGETGIGAFVCKDKKGGRHTGG